MVRKDKSFGFKYQNIIVGWQILNHEEMFVETLTYIRYVALTIIIFTYILAIELFYLTQICSFLGCFFEYLPLFLPLQVCVIYLTRFNKFRTFFPCSFIDSSVKVTDNFWKIHVMVGGFNESRRQISSGAEKTSDESMSTIQFCTTPKVDLPHYSFIFGKPGPLGTDMKNVVCSRLGAMLHPEIQKGEEAMKTSKFQKDIGGTTAFMKRLSISTKGCGQLTSNDTYFADSWLSSVKPDEEMAAVVVDYCGTVKTSHKGFCLAMLEKLMKYWPVGSYFVMKRNPIFPD